MARIPRVTRSALTAQSNLQPEAGYGWAALATIAGTAEAIIRPQALQDAREQGAQATYRDEQGNLQVDEASLLGGDLAIAHNNAAFAAYLGQSRLDLRETLTELRAKHAYDPAAFKDAADTYVKNMTDNAPVALRTDIKSSGEAETIAMFDGLRLKQIDRDNASADKTSALNRAQLAEDVVALIQGGASFDDPRVVALVGKISAISAFRVNSAFIGETEAEANAFMEGIRGSAKVLRFQREIEDLGGAENITDEDRKRLTALLEDPDIDPATRGKMYGLLNGTLKKIDGKSFVRGMTTNGEKERISTFGGGGGGYGGSFGVTTNDSMNPLLKNDGSESLMTADDAGSNMDMVLRGPFARLQENFGGSVVINDAIAKAGTSRETHTKGSQHFHGKALDISLEGMDDATRLRLVEAAKAAGFTGFGFGENILHVDVGPARSWSYKNSTFGGIPVAEAKAMVADAKAVTGVDDASREAAQQALTAAELPITPAGEAILNRYGIEDGIKILTADPSTPLGDLVEGGPDKTVGDVINDARKHMAGPTLDDLPTMRERVNDIPDAETRAVAEKELADWAVTKGQEKSEAVSAYAIRIARGEAVTKAEIMEDPALDEASRFALLNKIYTRDEATRKNLDTIAGIRGNRYFDSGSTKDRNAVDNAYRYLLQGADPLSPEGQGAAAEIVSDSGVGFVPKSFATAISNAMKSADPNDPERMERAAIAMGAAEQISREYPNAFGPYGDEIAMDIAEFRQELRVTNTAAGAITTMLERRTDEAVAKREKYRGEAKKFRDGLTPDDLLTIFDDDTLNQIPGVGLAVTDTELDPRMVDGMMLIYGRAAEEAFIETRGDKDAAKARAAAKVSRVFGVSTLNGRPMVMRLPPEKVYPQIKGSHEWIAEQLVADVALDAETDIPRENIFLKSDDETQADIRAGRPPSYVFWYTDADGNLQQGKDRFYGDLKAAQGRQAADAEKEIDSFNRKRRETEEFFTGVGERMGEEFEANKQIRERRTTERIREREADQRARELEATKAFREGEADERAAERDRVTSTFDPPYDENTVVADKVPETNADIEKLVPTIEREIIGQGKTLRLPGGIEIGPDDFAGRGEEPGVDGSTARMLRQIILEKRR